MKRISLLCLSLLTISHTITSSYEYDSIPAQAAAGAYQGQQANFSILPNQAVIQQSKSIDLSQLPEERTHDLVIINDMFENYQFRSRLPVSWNFAKNNSEQSSPFIWLLLSSLSSKKLTLCTELLWQHIQFIAKLFEDLATMKPVIYVAQKYIQQIRHGNEPYREFLAKATIYQPVIKALHHNFLVLTHQKSGDVIELPHTIDQDIMQFFSIFAYHNFIINHEYDCRKVGDHFLLFIPQSLQYTQAIEQPFASAMYHMSDIWLGIRHNHLAKYNYKIFQPKQLSPEEEQRILTKPGYSGNELLTILSNLFVNKHLITKEYQDYKHLILPEFNIFLGGHGSVAQTTAEISTAFKTFSIRYLDKEKMQFSTYNYQSSDLLEILKIFNKHITTKTLAINSCYSGGKKLQQAFKLQSNFNNPLLEELDYLIINIGISYTSTYTNTAQFILPLPNSNNQNYYQTNFGATTLSHINHAKLNPMYEYFEILNQPITTATAQQVSKYLQAASVFETILGQPILPNAQSFENYVLLKFPHTSWFTPAEFKQKVRTIYQTEAITKKDFLIPRTTQLILLFANVIPGQLTLEPSTPGYQQLIPSNYQNQNYVIHHLKAAQYQLLPHWLFNTRYLINITEPINIAIKQVTLEKDETKIYKNVYIFIHKNPNDFIQYNIPILGGYPAITGYIYTDTHQQTWIHYWPSSQSILATSLRPTLINTQNALKMLQDIGLAAIQTITQPGPQEFSNIERVVAQQSALAQQQVEKFKKRRAERKAYKAAKAQYKDPAKVDIASLDFGAPIPIAMPQNSYKQALLSE